MSEEPMFPAFNPPNDTPQTGLMISPERTTFTQKGKLTRSERGRQKFQRFRASVESKTRAAAARSARAGLAAGRGTVSAARTGVKVGKIAKQTVRPNVGEGEQFERNDRRIAFETQKYTLEKIRNARKNLRGPPPLFSRPRRRRRSEVESLRDEVRRLRSEVKRLRA